MLCDDGRMALIPLCCSLSMAAHLSPSSPFLRHDNSAPSAAIFAFRASWSADDWLLAGAGSPFGEREIDAALFPWIKSVGNDTTAAVNGAFLRSFKKVLDTSRLQAEVGDTSNSCFCSFFGSLSITFLLFCAFQSDSI